MLYDFEMTVKQANEQYEARVAELQLARQLPRQANAHRFASVVKAVKAVFASALPKPEPKPLACPTHATR